MKPADICQISDLTSANIMCWSSCSIDIDSTTYIVLWKWEVQEELPSDWEESEASLSDISYISESDLSNEGSCDNSKDDDKDDIPYITHTLPFKVIGVAHTKTYQHHLQKACVKLSEDKEPVTAHIMPKPDNEKD